jgi:hypothetical protein
MLFIENSSNLFMPPQEIMAIPLEAITLAFSGDPDSCLLQDYGHSVFDCEYYGAQAIICSDESQDQLPKESNVSVRSRFGSGQRIDLDEIIYSSLIS